MCMAACPYNARVFNWNEPVARRPTSTTGDKDVPVRPEGRGREVHAVQGAHRCAARSPCACVCCPTQRPRLRRFGRSRKRDLEARSRKGRLQPVARTGNPSASLLRQLTVPLFCRTTERARKLPQQSVSRRSRRLAYPKSIASACPTIRGTAKAFADCVGTCKNGLVLLCLLEPKRHACVLGVLALAGVAAWIYQLDERPGRDRHEQRHVVGPLHHHASCSSSACPPAA